MNQALYRKYRPKGWAEVVGQAHVVQTLRNSIARDRVGHAYLFAGPRGTGKTTVARVLAKAVNCLADDPTARPCNACEPCRAVNESRFLDLIEMDAASNTGVDDVRELRDKIGFSPAQGRFKVYIIDEVHMLSTAAFNALLKTLEEPPRHAIFILATTEIHKIPATVLSRCQRHEFRRVPLGMIIDNLREIVSLEGLQADEAALTLIARQATGSIRDAQSMLDQLASGESRITLQTAQAVLGTATSQEVLSLFDAIIARRSATALEILHKTLDSGVDPRTLARQIVDYSRGLMLIQLGNAAQVEATNEVREHMLQDASALAEQSVVRMMKAFSSAASDTRGGWQPSLGLELALAECFEAPIPFPATPSETPGSPPGVSRSTAPRTGPGRVHSAADRTSKPAVAGGEILFQSETKPGSGGAAASESPLPLPATSDEEAPSATDLTAIAGAWKEIRGVLKRSHPAADGLLNSCKPVEVRGDELVLGFQSENVMAIMDRAENMEAARRAIASVLGKTLRIRCVVINSRGKVPPNIANDGMVATAMNQGGQIVDLQE